MNSHVIVYSGNLRHVLWLNPKETYTIGTEKNSFLVVDQENAFSWTLAFNEGTERWEISGAESVMGLLPNEKTTISSGEKDLAFLLVTERETDFYDVSGYSQFRIAGDTGGDIQLKHSQWDLLLNRVEAGWQLVPIQGSVYVNNQVQEEEILLEKGDEVSFEGFTFKFYEEEIHVSHTENYESRLPRVYVSRYVFYPDYPDYHRSPRIIYRESDEKITLAAPPQAPSKPSEQLLRTIVPPIVMLGMTIIMTIIQPRGIYVLMTAGTTLVTLVFSISQFLKNTKKYKQDTIDREKNYKEYIEDKTVEIYEVQQEQKQGQLYHYPDIASILDMAKVYNNRIYEKTALHHDFLFYRLGLGKVKSSAEVQYSNTEKQKKLDALEKAGFDLYSNTQTIEGMPITANLVHGPVGYIGPRKFVIEQLHLLVNQLTFFHSYHDLQIVSIFPEEELPEWQWMRWLPQATLQEMNVRGFVYNQRSRDQVLNSLNQILKNRKNALDEKKSGQESTLFSPHYVVLVTDEKLILDHVIMEFFNEDPSELGCSVIFVQDVLSSLSENVKTVIDIKDRVTGTLLMEEGNLQNTAFVLDHFPAGFDKEELPRLLAPLNHLENLKSSIPESTTFMEMYNVERFDELGVLQRWGEHSPHKSLAVPLGLRGKDDLVYLNLHEKAHGPHGLVAGTTGSGKSEIIQSYILSLAVNFHPYDVAFLLIDYKGGGMANLFRNLPHLLGTITNLDGAQSMRALISINAELKRRQRLFSENNVNHINQYQKLYKNGDVKDPMPHLFLISDEFAELKSEQPEFMKELVSTARIGRSLGIHLILATQKPSGVVDDQIWSNSKFKLALKVADKSDSMEMLKTPDAAEITLPGRAYLQVGNNEIYELFQSAWSGADYQPDKDDQHIEDHTIYRINDLGQYEILSEDLSGLEEADEVKQIPTELDAVIDGIHELAEANQIEPLPRPWLPPLTERIAVTELHPVDYQEAWQEAKSPVRPTIGIVDVPSMQAQETLELNLSDDGHVAVFSSPGYGKSTFIQTVMMDLARVHNPARLHAYLLDFGTNGLLPLRDLPHIADTMGIDDEEKIGKFMRRMDAEVKRRKKLLSEYAVASMEMYEQASGKEEPFLFIVIDSFESFKGMKYEEDLEKIITQISREGASIGMHLILSAGRQGLLRMNLQSNIKIQIPLKMIDESEARNCVGRTDLKIDDLAGRGLIKLEQAELFQTALPTEGEDALQVINAIQEEAKAMDEAWTGKRPEGIPMIPEILSFEEFKHKREVQSAAVNARLPIGVDHEEVQPIVVNFDESPHLIVTGDLAKSFVPLKKSMVNSVELVTDYMKTMIIDSGQVVDKDELNVNAYIVNPETMVQVKEDLLDEIENREDIDSTSLVEWVIYITDMEKFEKLAKLTEDELKLLLQLGEERGLHFILAGDHQYMAKTRIGLPRLFKKYVHSVVVTMRLTDQAYAETPYQTREPELMVGDAFYIINKEFVKIRHMRS